MNGLQLLKYTAVALITIIALQSCSRTDDGGPPVPELGYTGYSKFKNTAGKDSFVMLNLTFKDGDGDIGLSESDSVPPYSYGSPFFNNLFVEFYVIENGTPSKITSQFIGPDTLYKDTVNFSQRIKYLTPEGKNKSIKGRIDVITPFFLLDLAAYKPDSVYYEITLVDRSLNRSNLIKTPLIMLDF